MHWCGYASLQGFNIRWTHIYLLDSVTQSMRVLDATVITVISPDDEPTDKVFITRVTMYGI